MASRYTVGAQRGLLEWVMGWPCAAGTRGENYNGLLTETSRRSRPRRRRESPAVLLPEGSDTLPQTQRVLWKWLTQDCSSQVATLDATGGGGRKSPGQDARAPGPAALDSVCDLGPVPSWPCPPGCPSRRRGEVLTWSQWAFLPQASWHAVTKQQRLPLLRQFLTGYFSCARCQAKGWGNWHP